MEYWKYKAIDRLKDYPQQKISLKNLSDEIARLASEACSIKSATGDGTPVKGGGSGREDRLLDNIVERNELKMALARAKLACNIVERGLMALSKEERRMLDLIYIQNQSGAIERLADELCLVDTRSVYKRLDKVLRKFTIALYGITEN